MPDGEELSGLEKYTASFWDWIDTQVKEGRYTPAEADILRGWTDVTKSPQWDYFLVNVYGLQPGQPYYPEDYTAPVEPLPKGRPPSQKNMG